MRLGVSGQLVSCKPSAILLLLFVAALLLFLHDQTFQPQSLEEFQTLCDVGNLIPFAVDQHHERSSEIFEANDHAAGLGLQFHQFQQLDDTGRFRRCLH